MYCKDCKWWESKPINYEDINICQLMTSEDGSPLHNESLASARDAERYYAWVQTAGDFGCVQFEEKAGQ